MKAYETTTKVEPAGEVRVRGVPFTPGTEVDVIVTPKRRSPEEFTRAWEQLCREIRGLPHIQKITDEDIQKEIDDYRAGR